MPNNPTIKANFFVTLSPNSSAFPLDGLTKLPLIYPHDPGAPGQMERLNVTFFR